MSEIRDIIEPGIPGPAADASPELIAAAETRAEMASAAAAGPAAQAALDALDVPSRIDSQITTTVAAAVPDLVADAVSNNPEVLAEAAALAQEDAGLVRTTDTRLPRVVQGEDGTVYFLDKDGWVSAEMNTPDAVSRLYDIFTNRISMTGLRIVETPDGDLAFIDETGTVSMMIDATGRVHIWDAVIYNGGGGSAQEVQYVDLVIGTGQSNDEGRGQPVSPLLDFPHKRIYQATWDRTNAPQNPVVTGLAEATVPLQSQQMQTGLSINSVIAEEIAAATDGRSAVVVLNAAAGGSGLVNVPAQGCWRVGYTGSQPQLFNIAKAAITATVAAIQARFPGATIRYWFTWLQGEADGSSDPATYAAELDAVFAGLRAHVGNPYAPIVVGGMVPEYLLDSAGKRAIRDQLALAQSRNEYVAYVDGVTNGGGSQTVTDRVHYGRAAVKRLGRRMWEGLQRAAVSTATSVPHKPLDVSAQRVGTTLRIKWSEPETRYTNFVVEYSSDGAAWTAANRTSVGPLCEENVAGVPSGGSLQVRISTVNESATTEATVPIYATGV